MVREMQLVMGDVVIFILLSRSNSHLHRKNETQKNKYTEHLRNKNLRNPNKLIAFRLIIFVIEKHSMAPRCFRALWLGTSIATMAMMLHLLQQRGEPFSHGLGKNRGFS